MRDAMKRRLRARFDIRLFHARVLGGGAMPLDLLEPLV
jgi:uncharacterized protein (DUF885 family)